MNFFNRIFGTIVQKTGFNSFFGFGSLVPRWSAVEAQSFYNDVPELRSIIDAQAAMFSKIKFQYVDKEGKPTTDPAKALFDNPNPYQDPKEFEALSHKILNLNGIVFFYINDNAGSVTHIYPLSVAEMEFMEKTDKKAVLKWSDLFTSVKAIFPYSNGQMVTLDKSKLYFIADSNVSINKALTGNDKIESMRKALSNLLAVAEAENILLNERGAIGIYSPKPLGKDDFGGIVMADEKAQIAFDEKLKTFGTNAGQSKYLLASTPYDFQRTVLTPAELGLEESRKRNKIAINDVFQHSILLSNELEGSTFSNMNAVKSAIYENKIIPDALKFAGFKTAVFAKNGGKYIIDISEIESLKDDDKLTADTNKANADLIISLNKEVQAGNITFEIAVSFLVGQCNYEQQEAEILINKTIKTVPNV